MDMLLVMNKGGQKMQSRALSKIHEGLEIVKDPQATLSRRYNYLCRIIVQICAKAAESEETFTLLENKSGQLMDEVIKSLQNASLSSHYLASTSNDQVEYHPQLMDEVIKSLQNASVSSHYLASTSNDQVEYHPQNVEMDSQKNEGYDYGLSTKTIYPTTSIVINGIKEKKRVGRIRQPKCVLNGKKKKQKSKGEDHDETSITQSDNAQHSLNISQNCFVQGFTHSNYQCNIPFILPNNQLGSVSASSLLNLVHTLPTLSNSQIDLQHTTQLHQSEEYSVGTTQHPTMTGFQFQPNQSK